MCRVTSAPGCALFPCPSHWIFPVTRGAYKSCFSKTFVSYQKSLSDTSLLRMFPRALCFAPDWVLLVRSCANSRSISIRKTQEKENLFFKVYHFLYFTLTHLPPSCLCWGCVFWANFTEILMDRNKTNFSN